MTLIALETLKINPALIGIAGSIKFTERIAAPLVPWAMQRTLPKISAKTFLLIVMVINRGALWGGVPITALFPPHLQGGIYLVIAGISAITSATSGGLWSSIVIKSVPDSERARYMATRTIFASAVTIPAAFVGTWIVGSSFAALYAIGAALVVADIWTITKFPDPEIKVPSGYVRMMRKPLINQKFRRKALFLGAFTLVTSTVTIHLYTVMLDMMRINPLWLHIATISSVGGAYVIGKLGKRFTASVLWACLSLALSCLLWAGLEFPIPQGLVIGGILVTYGFYVAAFSLVEQLFSMEPEWGDEQPAYNGMLKFLLGSSAILGGIIGGLFIFQFPILWITAVGGAALLIVGAWFLGIGRRRGSGEKALAVVESGPVNPTPTKKGTNVSTQKMAKTPAARTPLRIGLATGHQGVIPPGSEYLEHGTPIFATHPIDYIRSLERASKATGIPVIAYYLPWSVDMIRQTVRDLDIVIFGGGEDWGQARIRDTYEYALMGAIIRENERRETAGIRPLHVVATCRGTQGWNMHPESEGENFWDIASQLGAGHLLWEWVTFDTSTEVGRLLGERRKLRHLHHQGIRKVGKFFRSVGQTNGVHELLSGTGEWGWIIWMAQFHPEIDELDEMYNYLLRKASGGVK